jgi:hypothetical protein
MRNYKTYSVVITILLAWLLLGFTAQKEELARTRAQLATVSVIAGRADAELTTCLGWQGRVALSIERFTDLCVK